MVACFSQKLLIVFWNTTNLSCRFVYSYWKKFSCCTRIKSIVLPIWFQLHAHLRISAKTFFDKKHSSINQSINSYCKYFSRRKSLKQKNLYFQESPLLEYRWTLNEQKNPKRFGAKLYVSWWQISFAGFRFALWLLWRFLEYNFQTSLIQSQLLCSSQSTALLIHGFIQPFSLKTSKEFFDKHRATINQHLYSTKSEDIFAFYQMLYTLSPQM